MGPKITPTHQWSGSTRYYDKKLRKTLALFNHQRGVSGRTRTKGRPCLSIPELREIFAYLLPLLHTPDMFTV